MFRSKPYLENTTDVQVRLDTPIELPQNNQFQTKRGYKFYLDRPEQFLWLVQRLFPRRFQVWSNWANGANIGADTQSAPINGSFSLIKSLKISSAGNNFRYRKNDYNTGVQLQLDNFEKLCPIILFRSTKHQRKYDRRPETAWIPLQTEWSR